MFGRGQPGRSRRGQCPRHGGARTPASLTAAPQAAGPAAENVRIAAARKPPAARRFSGAPVAAARLLGAAHGQGSGLGGGRKSQALGSCLIGLVLVFSATPPVAGRVAPLQPPPPLRFSGCGTGWKEQMGTLSMRLARPAPPPPLSCAALRTEHAQPLCRPRQASRSYPH